VSEQDTIQSDAAETAAAAEEAAESPAPGAANGASETVSREHFEAVQAQAQQYMEGWQRERAEFANFKRRVERERIETYQHASVDVIKQLLPIVDDFERAMANIPEELKDNPWVSGVSMIGRKFERLLEQFSVSAIDPTGQPFNAEQHEAVVMDESETVESGHVIETLQRGYMVGDRVIRPALVRVAR
jgi:molecular chaperone GrpE